jgi:SnoaL-like domain
VSAGERNSTEKIARRYFEAWTSRDTPTSASLLAEDFKFTAGDMSFQGRDAFLDQGSYPQDAKTTLVAEAYQGEIAFLMYDASRGEHTVRIVEQLRVSDGLIQSSAFVADMTAFMAFMGAGNPPN